MLAQQVLSQGILPKPFLEQGIFTKDPQGLLAQQIFSQGILAQDTFGADHFLEQDVFRASHFCSSHFRTGRFYNKAFLEQGDF